MARPSSPALAAGAAASAAANAPTPVSGLNDAESRIYHQVFESVMNQRVAPGTKLPEQALADLFGVHRAVVRKVLQRLAHERIVDLRPNRGAVVAERTLEETRQIFEARRQLEASIVPLAVARIGKAQLQALRRRLRDEAAAVHAPSQPAWARLASSFHLRLAEVAGNAILQRYLHELITRCALIVALYEAPGNAACEHDEHVRIVDHLENAETAKAVKLMGEHLLDLELRLQLDRPQSEKTLGQMLGLV